MNPSADDFPMVADIARILKPNQQTVRNWIEPGIPRSIHYLDFGVIPTGRAREALRGRTSSSGFRRPGTRPKVGQLVAEGRGYRQLDYRARIGIRVVVGRDSS
jgi:hypothetical protein